MKWILPISLIILLSFVSTFDTEHKEVNEKTIKRMVEHLTKIRNLFRNLDEEDTGSDSESSESSDESGTEETGNESGNQTVSTTTAQVTALTTVGLPQNNDAPIKVLDFHSFNAPYAAETLSFVTVFFFETGKPPGEIIFLLTLLLKSSLRNLQQNEPKVMDVNATCKVDLADANKEGENINYKCEAPKEPNMAVADVVIHPEFTVDGVKKKADEVSFSNKAIEAAGDLQNQNGTPNSDSIALKNADWQEARNGFTLTGDITPGNYNGKEGDKLNIDFKNDDGTKHRVDCTIKKIENNMNYTFACTSTDYLKGNLDTLEMVDDGNKKQLTIHMKDKNKPLTYDPSNSGKGTNPPTYRKSSSGLSGGAIAGIVIACAVVLIIASVIAMMMKKPTPPLDNSTSVVGLRAVDNYSQ